MVTKQNYILVNLTEFATWLKNTKFTRVIKTIQEHHTVEPSYNEFTGSNHFTMAFGMRDYHMKTCGYSDIAQHITIYPDGMVMICRSFNKSPAGIKGCNTYGLCIENVGYFDKGGDVMTEAQKKAILTVTALLCMKFNLVPSIDSITYHRWWDLTKGTRILDGAGSYKTCPGTNFFGGNSTTAAKGTFYPLVNSKITELKAPPAPVVPTFEENVNELVQKGIIGTAAYWTNNCVQDGIVDGKYALTILTKATGTTCIHDATTALVSKGVISSPDYWVANATSSGTIKGEYMRTVITNIAIKLLV